MSTTRPAPKNGPSQKPADVSAELAVYIAVDPKFGTPRALRSPRLPRFFELPSNDPNSIDLFPGARRLTEI